MAARVPPQPSPDRLTDFAGHPAPSTPYQRRGVLGLGRQRAVQPMLLWQGLDVQKASLIRRLFCDDEGWPSRPCRP